MNDELVKSFENLFDDSKYVPNPISLEGMEAYKKKMPISCCPYTDKEKKKLWEHGWVVTDIGHVKAAEYGGKYDDPKNWPDPDFVEKLRRAYKKYE